MNRHARPAPRKTPSPGRTVEPWARRIARWFGERGDLSVGLVALVVRWVTLAELTKAPSFYVPIIDERSYDGLARQLLTAHSLDATYFWQTTVYPLFLAAVYAVSNGSILAARLVQALLGATTAALTYRLGERVGGRRVGKIAGFTVALYGPLIFSEFELVATGWEVFWAVSLPLVAMRVQARPRKRELALLGAMGGLSIATRATFVVFVAGLAIWLARVLAKSRGDLRPKLGRMSLFASGVLAVLLPLAIVNRSVTGHFGFLPSSGGINLYIGNNPHRERTVDLRPGPEWDRLASMPREHGAVTPYAKDDFFRGLVVDYVRTEPADFLAGLAEKTMELVSAREIARNLDVYTYRPYSTILSILTWRIGPFAFPFGLLFPIAVLGAALKWRRLPAPLQIFLGVHPLAIVLVFASARYRVPLVPALAIGGALAIESLVEATRKGRWAALAGYSAGMTGALLASTWPGPFPGENRDYSAEMRVLVANAELEAGRADVSEALLTEALDREPKNKRAHGILGTVRSQRGDYEGAAFQFEEALRIDPGDVEAHRGLGNLCVLTDKPELALTHYRQALEVDPNDAALLNNVGQLLHRAGDDSGAADALRRAISIDPTNAVAHFNLAEVLRTQGDLAPAAAHFRRAFSLGRTPEAATALARIEMDPGNVGLFNLDEAITLAQFAAEASHFGDVESVALLVEAYLKSGKADAARAVVARGIEVAQSRGDAAAMGALEPMGRALTDP